MTAFSTRSEDVQGSKMCLELDGGDHFTNDTAIDFNKQAAVIVFSIVYLSCSHVMAHIAINPPSLPFPLRLQKQKQREVKRRRNARQRTNNSVSPDTRICRFTQILVLLFQTWALQHVPRAQQF